MALSAREGIWEGPQAKLQCEQSQPAESKQAIDGALFQGSTHLLCTAGEATSSAWNQPNSQPCWMQVTSSIVKLWYQLPHIATKYGLLYVVLCVFGLRTAVDSQPWSQNMTLTMGEEEMQFFVAALQHTDRWARWSGHQGESWCSFLGFQQRINKKNENWPLSIVSFAPLSGSCGDSQVFSPAKDSNRCCKPSTLSSVFGVGNTLCPLSVPGDRCFLFNGSISVYTYVISPALSLVSWIHSQLHKESLGEVPGTLTTHQENLEWQDM